MAYNVGTQLYYEKTLEDVEDREESIFFKVEDEDTTQPE